MNSRGSYFRMRLKQSLTDQNYVQDVAFHEFKNWCVRWENIMHRVRYISGVVARQLSDLTPSIIDILIEEKDDQPTWSMGSMVFCNDNQALAHYKRIKELPKPEGFEQKKREKQREMTNEHSEVYDTSDVEDEEDDGFDEVYFESIHHTLTLNHSW